MSELITIKPDNHEHWLKMRQSNINSTDISALFDCNPYLTEFELWHQKKDPENFPSSIKDSERLEWGRKLEDVIAEAAATRLSLKVKPLKDYSYLPNERLGSSFDYVVMPTTGNVYDTLIECKNVDFLAFQKNWIVHDEHDIEAPPHIELQVQHQMLLSGMSYAYICALVGGNKLYITKREMNKNIHDLIYKKAAIFWQSIDENKPPKINYERDYEFVQKIYSFAEPNKKLDAKNDPILDSLVEGYQTVSKGIKELTEQKETFKAKILEHIKDHEKVLGQNYTISAGIMPEVPVSFTRKSFRNFKITTKSKA